MAETPLHHFRISDEEWATITQIALASGTNVSEWVRVAIRKQLDGPTMELAKAWDEGNGAVGNNLPRCPICVNRIVSMKRFGAGFAWFHDDDGTVICGGHFTEAIHLDENPYRVVLDNKEEQK